MSERNNSWVVFNTDYSYLLEQSIRREEAKKMADVQPDRNFDTFMQQVRDLMEGKAKTKGYHNSTADGPNQLYEFVEHHCPGHTEGEIIYKVVRYVSKRDPVDLLKIAAWAFLKWRHHAEAAK